MLGNPVAAIALVLVFRYPLNTALTFSASLAQIGEFSFILASLGVALGLLPTEGQSLILSGAMITIALNPLFSRPSSRRKRWIRARSTLARTLERSEDPLAELPMTIDQSRLTGHIVLVGYGRVGRRIAEALTGMASRLLSPSRTANWWSGCVERNVPAVSGDASDPAVLIQAHVHRASLLVIATPDTFNVRKMVEIARMVNPAHRDRSAYAQRGRSRAPGKRAGR